MENVYGGSGLLVLVTMAKWDEIEIKQPKLRHYFVREGYKCRKQHLRYSLNRKYSLFTISKHKKWLWIYKWQMDEYWNISFFHFEFIFLQLWHIIRKNLICLYFDICMQRMCFYVYKESIPHIMVKKGKKYFKKPIEASTVPPNCAQTNGFN